LTLLFLFQVFVRCKARLLLSCANKHKSFLASQSPALKSAVQQLIKDVHFMCSIDVGNYKYFYAADLSSESSLLG
jgi:hypothetical protein